MKGALSMKRITSIILTILAIASVAVFPASADIEIKRNGEYIYMYVKRGVVLLDYIGKNTKVTVPSKIDGKKVVQLGIGAYEEELDSILDLGEEDYGGFSLSKVKEVTVPGSVYVASGAFYYCSKLEKVTLKSGIKDITLSTFMNCKKLKKISIPNTVTEISDWSFKNCQKLKSIKLSSNLKYIDEYAFENSGLKSVSIGKNVKYISRYAFQNSKLAKITVSSKNKKYSSKNGVLYNKKKTRLIIYPNYRKGAKFTTPSSVEQIKPYAFSGSKFLKKIVLSKKIKKISTGAFDKCKKLKSVVFKSKKKIKIAPYAFLNCKAMKSVTIPKNVIKIATKSFGFTSRLEKNHNDYTYKKIKGFTIKGKKNSAAHKYAKKYKFKFVKK